MFYTANDSQFYTANDNHNTVPLEPRNPEKFRSSPKWLLLVLNDPFC